MDVRKEEGKKEEKKYNDDERYYNHNNNTHTVSPTSSLYCGIKILRPLSLSEKQRVKINRVTSRKKHHDLLMCVCPEEAEESSQAPLAGHHHVVLGELLRRIHCLGYGGRGREGGREERGGTGGYEDGRVECKIECINE